MCSCLLSGLFPGCEVGGLAALVLGAFAALFLLDCWLGVSCVCDCGSPWVLGVGGVTGAFVLWNRPCHRDINERNQFFMR